MNKACTYCGSDVHAHEPVFVDEEQRGERTTIGQFCNYACLAQHIENNELETGACCQLDRS